MDPLSVQGDQHTGAAHLYVKETLEALGEAGVETLAVTRLNDPRKPRLQPLSDSVRLVRIELGGPTVEPKQYFWGKETRTLEKIDEVLESRDFRPDLVHSVYWYSGKVGITLAERFRMPHVYTIISLGKVKHQALDMTLNAHDRDREATEQVMFQKSDRIISVCQQEKENLLRLYPEEGVRARKIAVVGRGVDQNLFAPSSMLDGMFPVIDRPPVGDRPYLFFAGRLIPSKGLPFLLTVYEGLLADETIPSPPQLIIAGGTPAEVAESQARALTSPLLKQAHERGDICWLGMVPRKQMPILYSNALLTCLPSIYDPAARVILESMACGTPVLMTNTGYAEEVVMTGVNGYVAPYGDKKLWLSHIKAVLHNTPWADKLAARTRPSVIPYFSLVDFSRRHLAAYRSIWANDDAPLEFSNPGLSSVDEIWPHWDVPGADEPEINPEEVAGWCRSLGLEGELTALPVSQIASSRVFALETDDGTYIIKRPKAKLLFYRMFYPTQAAEGVDYRPARARWQAEQTFAAPPLFQAPVAVHEDLLLILSQKYVQQVLAWDVPMIETFFDRVRQFQEAQTARFAAVLKGWALPPGEVVDWAFFREYDSRLNRLNASFRGGAQWFTPAHAGIELQRLALILASDLFPGAEDLRDRLSRQIRLLLDLRAGADSRAGIAWGGCRPGHVTRQDGRLFGIDAETACFGQPEMDFGQFLWWLMGLRGHPADPQTAAVVLGVLKGMPPEPRAGTLAWIWLTNLYWLWWDIARSRQDRLSHFVSFFSLFDTFLQESC
jgi:D-inositol-3-phosphate glycosyltransferase